MPVGSANDADKANKKEQFNYDVALRRLIYVALIGCAVILMRGLQYGLEVWVVTTSGLMAGGAALLTGGLLGFLFGVPHSREGGTGQTVGTPRDDAGDKPDRTATSEPSTTYRPNTSLEQISDWLTKILVGVGLIDIRQVLGKFRYVTEYVAKGLGGQGGEAYAFAATLLVYFAACGFVFGFLWARIYLPRWFWEADEFQRLSKKIDRLEEQQQADAKALTLVLREVNRAPDDPHASQQEIAEALKKASIPVRAHIFGQAQEISADKESRNYESRLEAVISVLNGLIASDKRERYHSNHSELSYAFQRQKPPDWPRAESEITKAIDIRDRRRESGWKYYEFHRARCRIEQDLLFKNGAPSEAAFVKQILPDLKVAYSQLGDWQRWCDKNANVPKWLKINSVDLATLGQT